MEDIFAFNDTCCTQMTTNQRQQKLLNDFGHLSKVNVKKIMALLHEEKKWQTCK